jgi:hypothetical protein
MRLVAALLVLSLLGCGKASTKGDGVLDEVRFNKSCEVSGFTVQQCYFLARAAWLPDVYEVGVRRR